MFLKIKLTTKLPNKSRLNLEKGNGYCIKRFVLTFFMQFHFTKKLKHFFNFINVLSYFLRVKIIFINNVTHNN